jgi:pyruvate kinase
MKDIDFNKTKIVATIGPASNTQTQLLSLIRAGVNVFRLNFSHGTHKEHLDRIKIIRKINKTLDIPVTILQDLQGPKIRVGEMENEGVSLKLGNKIVITTGNIVGTAKKISTSYKALPQDVAKGDIILIDDGNIEIRVIDKNDKDVFGQVLHGGILKSRKGINLPHSNVSLPSLTPKDIKDLEFGMEHEVDWIALSFVRSGQDIRDLRSIILKNNKAIKIVAKIEKPEAVQNIDEIIAEADALMVARGDLGVEIPMEQVPMIQKMIIKKCNAAAKPVIVATQMLESMIQNPRPTRAEASDVANAIMDGADAVMLSAETAAGKYPALAVRSMARIIRSVEKNYDGIYNKTYESDEKSPTFLHDQVLATAAFLAKDIHAKVITGMTVSGYSAFNLAKYRPNANIFIFTGSRHFLTQVGLVWGVRAFFYEKIESTDDAVNDIKNILLDKELLREGDVYVSTGTTPVASRKRTNTVRLYIAEHS